MKRFLRRNLGTPLLIAFFLLLTAAATEPSIGFAGSVNDTLAYSFYLLVIGVALHATSLAAQGVDQADRTLDVVPRAGPKTGARLPLWQKVLTLSIVLLAILGPTIAFGNYALSSSVTPISGTGHEGQTVARPSLTGGLVINGLVGFWPCDEATSGIVRTAFDQTTYANDGSPVGGPTYGAGKLGGACNFTSAKSQYIALPSTQTAFPTGDNPRSFFGWIRTNDSTDTQVIFSYGVASGQELIILDLNQDGQHRLYFSSDGNDCGITNTSIEDGAWHLVGFTYSGGKNLVLYVDAVGTTCMLPSILKTMTSPYANLASSANLGNPNYFSGQLEQIRFYNRVLNSSEIGELYSATG